MELWWVRRDGSPRINPRIYPCRRERGVYDYTPGHHYQNTCETDFDL